MCSTVGRAMAYRWKCEDFLNNVRWHIQSHLDPEDMVAKSVTQYWCWTEASKYATYKWSFHGKRGQGTLSSSSMETGPRAQSAKRESSDTRMDQTRRFHISDSLRHGRNIPQHLESCGTESAEIRNTIPLQSWRHDTLCWRSAWAVNIRHVILLRSSIMFITDRCASEDMVAKSVTQYWCCTEASKSATYKWSFHGKRGQGTLTSKNMETETRAQSAKRGSSDTRMDQTRRFHISDSHNRSWQCASCSRWHM